MSNHAAWRDSGRQLCQSLICGIGVLVSLFYLYTAFVGTYPALIQRSVLLAGALVIIFLGRIRSLKGGGAQFWSLFALLLGLAIVSVAATAHIILGFEAIAESEGDFTQADVILGTLLIAVLLIATWLTFGPALPLIAIAFLTYALLGRHMPGFVAHRGIAFDTLIAGNYLTTKGMWGVAQAVVADVVIYFLILTAFLGVTRASDLFMDLSLALVGRVRGGPAKIAVVSSALMGTLSGSAVANVVATGSLTIPMMRRYGYRPAFAGAVEAVASSGGQLMPPVMGTSAFIMADMLGTSYATIALAAMLPAILYYYNVFLVVDFEAARTGLRGLERAEIPSLRKTLVRSGHLLIPVIVLVALIIQQYSAKYSALIALATLIVLSFLRESSRLTPKQFVDALADGTIQAAPIVAAVCVAGIVIGVIEVTGLGLNLSGIIIGLAGESLIALLIATMVSSLVLGMGLPTVACYVILALVIAPVLIRLGVEPLAAHFFVFYYGVLSAITPPVALASFAASAIAGTSPLKCSAESVRIGLSAFFLPFIFVLQPGLLYQGDAWAAVQPVASAAAAIFAISIAFTGYFVRPVSLPARVGFFLSGLLLFDPGTVTDLVGAAILAALIAVELWARFSRSAIGKDTKPK